MSKPFYLYFITLNQQTSPPKYILYSLSSDDIALWAYSPLSNYSSYFSVAQAKKKKEKKRKNMIDANERLKS